MIAGREKIHPRGKQFLRRVGRKPVNIAHVFRVGNHEIRAQRRAEAGQLPPEKRERGKPYHVPQCKQFHIKSLSEPRNRAKIHA